MKKMMEDGGEIEYYLKHGHTDIKKMATAHKMIQSAEAPEIRGAEQAEALLQLHDMTGRVEGIKQKDRIDWVATISEQASKNGVGDANAFAESRMDELELFDRMDK
jgi:hypothetical protein